jgi:hypothetical protein
MGNSKDQGIELYDIGSLLKNGSIQIDVYLKSALLNSTTTKKKRRFLKNFLTRLHMHVFFFFKLSTLQC